MKVRVIRVLDIVRGIYILGYFSNFNLYGSSQAGMHNTRTRPEPTTN